MYSRHLPTWSQTTLAFNTALVSCVLCSALVNESNLQVATDAIAQKLKVTSGALLSAVDPDGAAAAAGLLATRRGLGGVVAGDVIVALNGRQVLNGGDLFNALEQCAIGEKAKLTVLRSTDQVGCWVIW
jgi:S1-C subfamily serine protease